MYDGGGVSALTGGKLLVEACHHSDRCDMSDMERFDTAAGFVVEGCYNAAMYMRYVWFEDDGTLVMRPGLEDKLALAGILPGKLNHVPTGALPYIKRHRESCLASLLPEKN